MPHQGNLVTTWMGTYRADKGFAVRQIWRQIIHEMVQDVIFQVDQFVVTTFAKTTLHRACVSNSVIEAMR